MTDSSTSGGQAQGTKRVISQVYTLSSLVGGHPEALRTIYETGRPAETAELGDSPRGRLLALGPSENVFMAVRPIVRALATDALPWKGKVFDHGGNSGQNVVFGRRAFRFHVEVGPSNIDGKPTLLLNYGDAAYKNPWPVRAIVDELRAISPGVAIGPAFFLRAGRAPELFLWFGLELAN
jgi:hypothetical protein